MAASDKLFTAPTKAVASAGTSEPIVASPIFAKVVILQADTGNSGNIFIGDENVSSSRGTELVPGEKMSIGSEDVGGTTTELDLSDIRVDALISSDLVRISYIKSK